MTTGVEATTDSVISLRTSSPVLVGRAAELRSLVTAVERAPAVVLLAGEAGIGKTRLVHELVTSPAAARLTVALAACHHVREPYPYGAVIEALHAVADRLTDGRPLKPLLGALRPLLPEIADLLPPLPDPVGGERTQRHLLFRAVREALVMLAPVLLVIEDLHWADDASREMLAFLSAQRIEGLTVVLTYRHDERAGPPLGRAYRRLDGVSSAVLRLAPLDTGEVGELAAAIVGSDVVTSDFSTRLRERTGGVPFIVEEVLRALREPADAVRTRGEAARRLLDAVEVPALLRDMTAERLAELHPDAVRLARTAAVFGAPLDMELLGTIAGMPTERVLGALDDVLNAELLIAAGPREYGFRHPLARQAVYDGTPVGRRTRLHVAAAQALEHAAQQRCREVALHYRAAGRTADWARTAEVSADQAAERGDAEQAVDMLRELLTDPPPNPGDIDRLAVKVSRIAHNIVDTGDAVALLDRLLRDPRLSAAACAEVRTYLGVLLLVKPGAMKRARHELTTAVAQFQSLGSEQALFGMSVLAQPDRGVAPLSEHRKWMHDVDRSVHQCDDPLLRLKVMANHLHALVQSGDPHAWHRIADLPTDADDLAERRQLARAHCNLADACVWIGEYHRAREFLDTGRRLLASCDNPPYLLGVARCTETNLDWLTGGWAALSGQVDALLDLYGGLRNLSTELSLVAGQLALMHGNWANAESFLARTGMEKPDEAYLAVVFSAYAAAIRLHLANGEQREAGTAADRGIGLLRDKGTWVWGGELVISVAELMYQDGRHTELRDVVAEFGTNITGCHAPGAVAAHELCGGHVWRSEGDLATAAKSFQRAERAYEALPNPYRAAHSAELAAICRVTIGDTEPAAALLPVAARFDALGAVRDAARCRHLVRSGGDEVPSRRGRRGYGSTLSPRERDIAQFVAQGRTNREIAELLYLSPRTVERHVASLMRKLGLRRRGEIGERIEV